MLTFANGGLFGTKSVVSKWSIPIVCALHELQCTLVEAVDKFENYK